MHAHGWRVRNRSVALLVRDITSQSFPRGVSATWCDSLRKLNRRTLGAGVGAKEDGTKGGEGGGRKGERGGSETGVGGAEGTSSTRADEKFTSTITRALHFS